MNNNEEKMMRLQKYLSSAGVCSRRESEKYITDGRVIVNGKVAVLGDKVYPSDKVVFDGKELFLYNKKSSSKINVFRAFSTSSRLFGW